MQRAFSTTALVSALGLSVAAFACGGSESAVAQPAGERLYAEKGCTSCHGRAGEGTFMGPPLRNLSAHWQRDELAKFFLDPSGYAKGQPRLAEMMKAYRMPMTPIVASEADRLVLADHVLGMK
jgi:mono/diheme cytochrome c family protein